MKHENINTVILYYRCVTRVLAIAESDFALKTRGLDR